MAAPASRRIAVVHSRSPAKGAAVGAGSGSRVTTLAFQLAMGSNKIELGPMLMIKLIDQIAELARAMTERAIAWTGAFLGCLEVARFRVTGSGRRGNPLKSSAVDVGVAILTALTGTRKMPFLVTALTFGLAMGIGQRVSGLLMLIDIKVMGLETLLIVATQTAALQVGRVIKLPLMRILMALLASILLPPWEAQRKVGSQLQTVALLAGQI